MTKILVEKNASNVCNLAVGAIYDTEGADLRALITQGVVFCIADPNADSQPFPSPVPSPSHATGNAPSDFDLSALDNPVKRVGDMIKGFSDDHLQALLEAERNGKTRKGVIEILERYLRS